MKGGYEMEQQYVMYSISFLIFGILLSVIYVMHIANKELRQYTKLLLYMKAELEALKRRIDKC